MLKEEYVKTVSTLTNLPASFLSQLYKVNMLVVSNELHTQLIESEPNKKVSLSTYGEVRLHIENNNLIYKFIPSDEFNSVIRRTILEKKDLLEEKLEEKVVKKIYANYNDFMDGTLEEIEKKDKLKIAYEDIVKFVNKTEKIGRSELLSYIKSELVKAGMEEEYDKKK